MNKRIQEIKDALRKPYTMPGLYPKVFVAHDGCICHDCIRDNLRVVFNDVKINAGPWNVVVDVLWEGDHYCVVCSLPLESAYGYPNAIEV